MNDEALGEERTRRVMACLGDASRFRMVRALAEYDRCVGELAEAIGLSQSCTTRHLQVLERLGLVEGRREGRRVRFRLAADAPGLEELLGWALTGNVPARTIAAADPRRGPAGRGNPGPGAARPVAPGIRRRSPPRARSSAAEDVPGRSPAAPRGGQASVPAAAGRVTGGDRRPVNEAPELEKTVPVQRPTDIEDYLL